MARQWIQVEEAAAKKHKLYGVRGWLLLLVFGIVMSPLFILSQISIALSTANLSFLSFLNETAPDAVLLKLLLAIEATRACMTLYLVGLKSRNFRPILIFLVISAWPLWALACTLSYTSAAGSMLAQALIPWLLSLGVWLPYLMRSKRVRVTFENRLLTEKQFDDQKPSISPNISNQKTSSPIESVSSQEGIITDDSPWAQAMSELEGVGNKNIGLWARSFAMADGDLAKAQASYLRVRVKQIVSGREDNVSNKEEVAVPHETTGGASALQVPPTRVLVLPDVSSFEKCVELLTKHGCVVNRAGPELWNVRKSSGVIAYAYSLEALRRMALQEWRQARP